MAVKPELDVVKGKSLHDGCFFKKSLNPNSPITKGRNKNFIFNILNEINGGINLNENIRFIFRFFTTSNT